MRYKFWLAATSIGRRTMSGSLLRIVTFRGGSALLDIAGHVAARHIAVYDSETGKEVSSVPVPKTYRYVFGFYLSPDGHQLAILQDGVLSIRNLE
jgi:hypothetical protein